MILVALILLGPVTAIATHWKSRNWRFEAALTPSHNVTTVEKDASLERTTSLSNESATHSIARKSKNQDRLIEDLTASPWKPPAADATPTPAGPTSTSKKIRKKIDDRILPGP